MKEKWRGKKPKLKRKTKNSNVNGENSISWRTNLLGLPQAICRHRSEENICKVYECDAERALFFIHCMMISCSTNVFTDYIYSPDRNRDRWMDEMNSE